MAEQDRYSMRVGDMGQQELDLLECLVRIDRGHALDPRAGGMRERLIVAGLADAKRGALSLTLAGIERCQSLMHRMASDREAAKVLVARGIVLEADAPGELRSGASARASAAHPERSDE